MFTFLLTFLLATLLASTSTSVLASPLLTRRNIGGIRMCTKPHWEGDCWYGIMPLNQCVALNSFAGKVLSFRPDDGTECFLMQGRCNAEEPFVSMESNTEFVGDLTQFDWIADAYSFVCMTAK